MQTPPPESDLNRGLNVFVWVWNQSEGSVSVFTLEPWKVKVRQAHRRSERETKRSLEEKLSCCLPTDDRQTDSRCNRVEETDKDMLVVWKFCKVEFDEGC